MSLSSYPNVTRTAMSLMVHSGSPTGEQKPLARLQIWELIYSVFLNLWILLFLI